MAKTKRHTTEEKIHILREAKTSWTTMKVCLELIISKVMVLHGNIFFLFAPFCAFSWPNLLPRPKQKKPPFFTFFSSKPLPTQPTYQTQPTHQTQYYRIRPISVILILMHIKTSRHAKPNPSRPTRRRLSFIAPPFPPVSKIQHSAFSIQHSEFSNSASILPQVQSRWIKVNQGKSLFACPSPTVAP